MIRQKDFEIHIDSTPDGTNVLVTHIPTGNTRSCVAGLNVGVGRLRDALIAELKGLLFDPKDIQVDVGRTSGGDFIRVTHIPSGVARTALRKQRSEIELLDEVLCVLYTKNPQDHKC